MLKNWTVKTQSIKKSVEGLTNYFHYLVNQNAPSHEDTQITDFSNSRAALLNIIQEHENRKSKRKLEKKAGGRPISSLAQSFVLSLPKEIKPTPQEWEKIGKDCIKAVAQQLDVPAKNLYKITGFVLHDEPHKNSHLNLVFGKVLNDVVLTDLQRKNTLKTLKNAFNIAVLKHHNKKLSDYQPKNTNIGNKSRWQHYHERLKSFFEYLKAYINAETVDKAAKHKAKAVFKAEMVQEGGEDLKIAIKQADEVVKSKKGEQFESLVYEKSLDHLKELKKERKEKEKAKNKQKRKRRRRKTSSKTKPTKPNN